MTRTDEFDRSITYGEAALTYLKGNRTPAYPRNYELWYIYAAGFNRELNKAVNDALKRLGHLPEDLTERFYDEFLSPVRLSDRVGEVSARVSKELDEIVEMLEASSETCHQYGQSLRTAASGLGSTENKQQTRSIIEKILRATTEMEARNTSLESQLKDSKGQITDLQESLEAIRYESLTDQLTGLANRKHFDQSLERAVDIAMRRGEPVSLAMCDIDHFKQFNDTFGHQTGDQVLRLVGAAIRSAVKGRDIASRYGGEEFAVILPSTALDAAVYVGEDIRTAVMAKELIKRSTGESLGRITMSVGIATLRHNDTRDSLVERADMALYASKRNGRNRVTSESDLSDEPHKSAVA
ncbi:GGDEF domain-containing protein [Microbaculum marinisediminis]|uniref:diguanylate cyclase n=1 Tax=Microbaculum marinisediminis TaxID=2931392 RepID=A0AAW5R2D5_9HYPH|nr:GGDEF domain-containing protein [Microbaculum sp. A6E488]MCT8974441.1 GGDEF domain-containing protein [Microbaculum sp. A6E488]